MANGEPSYSLSQNRGQMILLIVGLTFFAWAMWTWVDYRLLRLRVLFAKDQIAIFQHVVERAIVEKEISTEQAHEQIESYYPSGTKQVEGSELDSIVESARRIAETSVRTGNGSEQKAVRDNLEP